jgi:hypothetical protein
MNYAIKFSGNNCLEQNFDEEKSPGFNDFTVQCWLKTRESGPLFLHHSEKNGTYFSLAVTIDGKISFSAKASGFDKDIKSVQGGINNGEWSSLSAIKKGDDLSIIINGKTISTTEAETTDLPDYSIEGVRIGKSVGNEKDGQFFNGELGGIAIWKKALSTDEVVKYYQVPVTDTEEGLLFSHPFAIEEAEQNNLLQQEGCYVQLQVQKVKMEVFNKSLYDFKLSGNTGIIYSGDWPDSIPSSDTSTIIELESSMPNFSTTATYIEDKIGSVNTELVIEVNKSLTFYESYVKTIISPDLERQISVKNNEELELAVELRISENLVVVNAINLNKFLNKVIPLIGADKVVTSMNYDIATGKADSSAKQIVEYNQACQLFNRRINRKPLAIVYCSSVSDVEIAYAAAIEFNLPIRVRTGGHDHEGECSGTNTILIDLIGLTGVVAGTAYDAGGKPVDIAVVRAGNRFITLTSALADQEVMLPHGTCATVAIPGFTMGGGWGPYTRKQGMCCEHLVGAQIVLGNGETEVISTETLNHDLWMEGRRTISINKYKEDLVWALKGGGGMSYGIVTAFIFRTFKLPKTLVKFELEWNKYERSEGEKLETVKTLKILTLWEEVIGALFNPSLTGTNLKINGEPLPIKEYRDDKRCEPIYEDFNADTVVHNCVMYGYWEGNGTHEETIQEVEDFIKRQFTDQEAEPAEKRLDGIGGLGKDYNPRLESWDRESHSNVLLKANSNGQDSSPYPPDLDEPAPHKITSRFVNEDGLKEDGRKALLDSLTSRLIVKGNRAEGLFTYVTLGAIAGEYYQKVNEGIIADNSAFPYKDKKFIIQYQTWWNLELAQKEELQDNAVYTRTNRALDWMEASRDFVIPNTDGAFISFKDNSIPTETYFAQNYDKLKRIKKNFSEDPKNHFRTRKTII